MLNLTLTSDFGIQSHLIASSKGKIISKFESVNIIDISHSITPYNLSQATYIFKNSYHHFPRNTFHILLNDLYESPKKQILYVYENGQHIFCPDNGFLTLMFDDAPIQLFKLIDTSPVYDYIHVLDLVLSEIESLIHGDRNGIAQIAVDEIVIKNPIYPTLKENLLEVQVLFIDNYGNVILNITKNTFEEMRAARNFKILFMRDEEVNQISKHYNDVAVGNKLCLFNASNYLEIAVNKGNASSLFGFNSLNDKLLFYNTVKIFFE